MAVFSVTASDTGVTVTTVAPQRTVTRRITGTGLTVSSSLRKTVAKQLSDTGLTVSETLAFRARLTDTGLAVSDSLRKLVPRRLTDTGLSLADSLGRIELTDTGLSFSTSLRAIPIRPLTATGLTITDSTRKVARKVISDTGLTFNSSLVARKNGGNASINIADVGLVLSVTLADVEHYFRAIPNSFVTPDRGATITDGITVTINGGPVGSCYVDFRRFLGDLDASPEYAAWCSANPADCSAWTTYVSAILGGGSPAPPSMTDGFGTALVDVGVIALDGIVPCRANLPSGRPHAAFSFAVSGLAVDFTNLSTPGASGLFDSWLWTFGDGDTDTNTWSPGHVYVGAGTYTVTLTVGGANNDGISSVRHTVRVFVPAVGGIHIDAVII